jgi:hypothetical protein
VIQTLRSAVVAALALATLGLPSEGHAQTVETFVPSSSGIQQPSGMVFDGSGNLFVATAANNILKVKPDGSFTVFASGLPSPHSLAFDASGNLYAGCIDGSIQEVSPSGTVSPFVAATSSGPPVLIFGMAFDGAGNLYFATYETSTISKVTPAGVVSTFVSSGLNMPIGMAIDGMGNLIVANNGSAGPASNTVVKVDPSATVTPIASILEPSAVAIDGSGNIYVSDQTASISEISGGTVTTVVPLTPGFEELYGMAFDHLGNLYVSNAGAVEIDVVYIGTPAPRPTPTPAPTPTPTPTPTGLTPTPTPTPTPAKTARLINLSVRSNSGSGPNILIAGFVISGSSKSVLVRGDGPSLAGFGVDSALAGVQLSLFDSQSVMLAQDVGWAGSQAEINLFKALGAFPFATGSLDSALVETLGAGAYTAQASGTGGATGVALVEVYDADGSAAARLVNESARTMVGTGSGVLIAGFVVGGEGTETLLVRGIGPGLGAFGISGYLATPTLTIYDANRNPMASNTGWGGTTTLRNAFQAAGAFSLDPASADCALLITLPSGAYTAEVTGAAAATGVALVEVYELP